MGRMRGKLAVLLCALLAFNASSIAYGGSNGCQACPAGPS